MVDEQNVVGRFTWLRPPTPYEMFVAAEGLPIHAGLGFRNVRDLQLGDWGRLGARGAYLQLDGIGAQQGFYLLGLAPGQSSEPERHLYEEVFFVLQGHGSADVWTDSVPAQRFTWQPNSVFSVPLNSIHRFTNESSKDALILAATNAPPIFETFDDRQFIFETSSDFATRYVGQSGFFEPMLAANESDPAGRAMFTGSLIPDATEADVPLDGRRGPGHRHMFMRMSGNKYRNFLAEYPAGRYSKAHYHQAGPIVVCVAGQGYTLTWPKTAGPRPFQDGLAHLVQRQDYVSGGLISAVPDPQDEWFHAHFGTSAAPLRTLAMLGAQSYNRDPGQGKEVIDNSQDIELGGKSVSYVNEDPEIRRIYAEELSKSGLLPDMPESLYQRGFAGTAVG